MIRPVEIGFRRPGVAPIERFTAAPARTLIFGLKASVDQTINRFVDALAGTRAPRYLPVVMGVIGLNK